MNTISSNDPRTEGERVWDRLRASLPQSHVLHVMCAACTVSRYDGQVLVLSASPAVAEFMRAECTEALREARSAVCPGVQIKIRGHV